MFYDKQLNLKLFTFHIAMLVAIWMWVKQCAIFLNVYKSEKESLHVFYWKPNLAKASLFSLSHGIDEVRPLRVCCSHFFFCQDHGVLIRDRGSFTLPPQWLCEHTRTMRRSFIEQGYIPPPQQTDESFWSPRRTTLFG